MVTTQGILADLRSLGIAEGMHLVVHSCFSNIGRIEKGAEAVIETLLGASGGEGTLTMPTFPAPPNPVLEPKTTPSSTDRTTETSRTCKGVVRSILPFDFLRVKELLRLELTR